jgi:hypothetical protein
MSSILALALFAQAIAANPVRILCPVQTYCGDSQLNHQVGRRQVTTANATSTITANATVTFVIPTTTTEISFTDEVSSLNYTQGLAY